MPRMGPFLRTICLVTMGSLATLALPRPAHAGVCGGLGVPQPVPVVVAPTPVVLVPPPPVVVHTGYYGPYGYRHRWHRWHRWHCW